MLNSGDTGKQLFINIKNVTGLFFSQRRRDRREVIVFLCDLCDFARKILNMLFIPDSGDKLISCHIERV